MKKLLLLALVAVFGWSTAKAQLNQVVTEVVMDAATYSGIHGGLGNYPAGGTTYRVYAELVDGADFITSVTAVGNCYNMDFEASDQFWNTSFGGVTGPDLNFGFFGLAAEVEWDSMITIGRANSADPGSSISVAASNPNMAWSTPGNFVNGAPFGADMHMIDGGWYILNDGSVNGLGTGPNNRVLLAQFTTTAPLSFKINILVINDGIGTPANSLQYVSNEIDYGVCISNQQEIDGSAIGLIYPFVPGCDDLAACNYNAAATVNDGSCLYTGDPCDDGDANTFDDVVDGSCLCAGTPIVEGCTNSFALNYDAAANTDDGSCILPACGPVADSYCYASFGDSFVIDADGLDDIVLEILSGTTEIDFDDLIIYDGSDNLGTILYGPADGDHSGVIVVASSGNMFVEFTSDSSVSCDELDETPLSFNIYCGTRNTDVLGCTDPAACNYNDLANVDDGSCVAAVANDNCSGAIALSDGVAVTGDNTFACGTPDILVGPAGSSCDSQDGWCSFETDVDNDVWFSFTTPANDAEVTIETFAGSMNDSQLAVYGACADAGTFIAGNDDGGAGSMSLVTIGCGVLSVSTTYYVMVDGYNANEGTFDIVVNFDEGACAVIPEGCTNPAACNYDPVAINDDGSCIAAVANDNCSGAIALTSGVTEVVDNTLACGTPEVASVPGTGCQTQTGWCGGQTTVNADVWFSFTTPANDAQITVTTSSDGSFSLTDTQMAVYDACGGSLVAANDDVSGSVFYSSVVFACGSLAPSTTYYVLVDGYSAFDIGTCNIDLTIDEAICSLPVLGCTNPAACNYDSNADTDDGSCILAVANDDCANAIGVATDGINFAVDNSCASADGATPDCWAGNPTGNDVWYTFVAPASGLVTIETHSDGSFSLTDTQVAVYDACGGNELACDDDAGVSLYSLIEIPACDLVEGNTYWIQVNGYNGDSGTCEMNITINDLEGCTDPLSLNYDPCATINTVTVCITGIPGALALSTELFPSCTGVPGTAAFPGEGTGLPENGPFSGVPDDEVFYQFSAPCDGAVKVKVIGDGIMDAVVELYNTDLDFLGAADATTDGGTEIIYFDGVLAGESYYARVYDYYDNSLDAPFTFTICVSSFCASSPDDPYPSLTYDACDVYKCDNIPGADNYDWSLTPQGGGTELTYSSVGNYTWLNLSFLSGLVEYGTTYDVRIDANFTDSDLGSVTVAGVVTDVCVMNAGPSTQLRADYVGNTYDIAASLRCPAACNADQYIWLINPVGGSALAPVTVPGTSTLLPLQSVAGLLPGTDYEVQIAVVYEGVEYAYGTLLPFSTAAAPLLEVRAADICGNAGPLPYGYYIRTNVFAAGADDYTWAFTNTNGVEPTIFWRKGDGVRLLQLNAVKDALGNNLLVAGESYNVQVKAEYGTFLSQGNDNTALEPQYDFVTVFGAVQEVCVVGGAGAAGDGVTATRSTELSIEAALYPNPSTGDFVNLNLNNIDVTAEKVSVDIYDLFGKLVQSEQIATTGSSNLNVVLNLNASMASGLYMVNITVGEVVQTERLVIEK